MADRWMIRGTQFTNCNCDWGCPCQFGSPTTHGHCEALLAGAIEEGYFNETRLDGLLWVLLVHWPGEIVAGNGVEQAILDDSTNSTQREALRKILSGEATRPGATHFNVFASTMSSILEPLVAPINIAIDIEARKADVTIEDRLHSTGRPILSAFTGEAVRYGIHLPNGFEFTYAEVGQGITRSTTAIKLDLRQTHGHFNVLHMNQDGVIRSQAAAMGH